MYKKIDGFNFMKITVSNQNFKHSKNHSDISNLELWWYSRHVFLR